MQRYFNFPGISQTTKAFFYFQTSQSSSLILIEIIDFYLIIVKLVSTIVKDLCAERS